MFMQTVQLSCIEISTISEQTQPSFRWSLFSQEYHQVRLKWFLSLWYIKRKPCTYLSSKLTMSLNGPKQDSVCHMSSRSFIGCVKIDFQAYGMFHTNRAPTLYKDQQYIQTDRTKLSLEPLHLGVPTGASKMVSQTMVHQAKTVNISCTESNTVFKQTEARFHMTHVMEFYRVRPN